MKILLLPIRILIIFLILLALGACFSYALFDGTTWFILIRNAFLLIISSLSVFFVLQKLKLISPTRIEHRIITYLILFLLFDPLLSWWIFLLLGATTELLQRLIRTPSGPLLNPGAFSGLLFSFIGYAPSWWGVSYAPRIALLGNNISVAMFLTLLCAGYVAYRYRKLSIILTALIVFSLSYLILFGVVPLFIIADGTLAFFLLIMTVEPKTSPVLKKEQYIYGGIIGILIALGLYVHFSEAYLGSLVVANLYHQRRFLKTFILN